MKTIEKLASVLAIGAHPDDIELGCGGSLAKLAQAGVKVHALTLSSGARGTTEGHDRCLETRAALEELGVSDVVQFDFNDTRLSESTTDITSAIERECARLNPGRVYTMFRDDRHQDHRAVYETSIIACRGVSQILCYETPSSWPNFVPQVFEDISGYLDQKIKALKLHVSQQERSYMQADQVRCLAQFRGQQVTAGPSEAFILHKLIL